MKTSLSLLFALVAIFSAMKAKAQTNNSSFTTATLDWKSKCTGELKYLLYLPPDYSKSSDKKSPLMLFLHGAGERGADVNRAAIHGPMSLVRQGTNFPFIIVAPQCPAGQLWDNEPLLQLLDRIESNYAVDTNRIYLTGLSMGGYGTWSLAVKHPAHFAAVAPVCGGGERIRTLLPAQREALKTLAVWAFHGGKDNVVPLAESERMVDAFKKAGVTDIQLTVYPDDGHDSWTRAYNEPTFYDWLLKHSR